MNGMITTLQEAGQHMLAKGIVSNDMTVGGRDLLDVCGFDVGREAQSIKRQIEKHSFSEGKDFCTSMCKSAGGRPKTEYTFTFVAANHVLLAAMTEQGKAARQEAIDTKMGTDLSPKLNALESVVEKFGNGLVVLNEKIEQTNHQVNSVFKDVDDIRATMNGENDEPTPVGYSTKSTIALTHGVSPAVVKLVVDYFGVNSKIAHQYRESADMIVPVPFYNDVTMSKLINRVKDEAVQVSKMFCRHEESGIRFKHVK